MGLDMYLYAEIYQSRFAPAPREEIDGFPVAFKTLELGYWRKHPNLHGFIVKQFADGVDECQRIRLSKENLQVILSASEGHALPHTEGFFFGQSHPEDKAATKEILERAIAWLGTPEGRDAAVYYRASW